MDIVSIIVAAVGSGLVATIITLIVQRVSETKKLKICIFEILMSHRYLIADKENVEALNKVEVIFHKDSEVRKAWTDFLNAADAGATNPMLASTTNDKYLKLLEKIAKNIGYKSIDWENIKQFYFPQGLATKITEEELLRKAQLSQATAIAAQDTSTGQSSSEQLGMQIALKALENPDGFEKLARFAEMMNQGKKTGKR